MRIFYCLLLTGILTTSAAQSIVSKDGHFYFGWGYTRAWYSKSTIHFVNNSSRVNPVTGRTDNYDFTLHQVTAHDRSDFDRIKDVINITIPQFVFRIGFSLNPKWTVELNYDHTKYVVDDNQRIRISGRFNENWVDQDTLLNGNDLVHFEHTDGANFWMFNLVRKWKVISLGNAFNMTWLLKPGAGLVVPRTDVTLFSQRVNNDWKVAGWITGIESGARFSFYNKAYIEFVGKAVYANYVNVFVVGRGNGKANHHFFATQLTLTCGYQFPPKTRLPKTLLQ